MHVESWKMGSALEAEHDVQFVEVPRHVWHVELQFRHVPNVDDSVLRY